MVYDGRTLDRGSRKRVMDAFVVLDREQYIKLTGITPASKTIAPVQGYQPTAMDIAHRDHLIAVIESLFAEYGKAKYKFPFIKIIRGLVKPELPADKKWLYNQALIHLFTIDQF